MLVNKIQIGDHFILASTEQESVREWIRLHFKVIEPEQWDMTVPDMYIHLKLGYGEPFESFDVRIRQDGELIRYARTDFLLETIGTYREARLQAHDEVALKHGLMAFYSAFIVHHGWGLLIHSSCVVSNGKAYLFAGPSGAGKSTVASLSHPREVLSDEATLIKIEPDRALAYDSPFRSDSLSDYGKTARRLDGIHLLEQSHEIDRLAIPSSEAMLRLMDKIFYWAHDPRDTIKVLAMCRTLAKQVSAYRLKFQKNDLFWERIS
ncbi:hypothetical protein [Cohnella sp.]|uniref:hypothetical protein n=1 Tax=Cohnella sp. TaxID=1883426 RepID=UPI003567B44C